MARRCRWPPGRLQSATAAEIPAGGFAGAWSGTWVLVLVLLLVGCGQPAPAGQPGSSTKGTSTQASSTTEQEPETGSRAEAPVTVEDARGKRVQLAGPAERIVTIPMPLAAIVMAVDGSSDRIVGMHPQSMAAMEEGILSEIFPGALDARTDFVEGDFQPSVEAVLTLEPDLVFQWANRGDELLGPMESAGLDVFGVNYGDAASLEEILAMTGKILGKPARAERILDYHDLWRARLQASLEGLTTDEQPRVLYFLRYEEQLRVAGRDTYNDFTIGLAGGRNVAADAAAPGGLTGFYDVNVEQILAWDPEVILLGGFDAAVPEDLYTDPVLQPVSAVENRRVYKAPLGGYRWDPPSHESPLMWLWLARLLHPERIEADLRAETRELYAWMYAYALESADMDGILRWSDNRASRDYEQFAAQ